LYVLESYLASKRYQTDGSAGRSINVALSQPCSLRLLIRNYLVSSNLSIVSVRTNDDRGGAGDDGKWWKWRQRQ
jgi:hypothetical protein